MLSWIEFEQQYACNKVQKFEVNNWELSKPIGGMKLKQRIKDAWNVLLNRGVVVRWYE